MNAQATESSERRTLMLNVRLSEQERETYHAIARAEQRTLSDVIRAALAEKAATVNVKRS